MEQSFGKLVVIQQDAPGREFELGKASVTLGRSMTNDIILSDARVSRGHSRLECSAASCTIVDLGSANGTRVNGLPVDRVELKNGDTIAVGNTQLRYDVSKPFEEVGMTVIDTSADLDLTLDREILPMSINETHSPRLIIFTSGRTWEVPIEDSDRLAIGRTEDNQVVIEHESVSRHHAEVVRRGSAFLVRDLGSTNGVWLRGERVEESALQDGDVVRVGHAQLVFKKGFGIESLTMVEDASAKLAARRPVVFVPGMMGSELWRGNERVWPNVKVLFTNPEIFMYPSSVPLEPRGIVEEMVIVPNLIKHDQYNRVGDYLVEDLGYERGKDFFEFAYDWRQDVRTSARQLAQLIETLPVSGPITLMAHSLGTIVSRYYVEALGGKQHIERLLLMGGPHRGVVKALSSLLIAPHLLPFGLMGERLLQILASFPSSYQILPTYACGTDQNGNAINFLEDEGWLTKERIPLLRGAREFRQELGMHSSVPAVSIFGYGLKTIASVTVNRGDSGELSKIAYVTQPSGDSTIPENSAVLPNTEIHPVQQYHGSLFVDNDVKMRLKLELTRPPGA